MEVGILEKIGIWENGKACGCGGRKRIKEKRKKEKKLEKRRYFLGREDENNGSGGFPGFSCGC